MKWIDIPSKSHSGMNLAVAFMEILNDFGIADKVSNSARYDSEKHSPRIQLLGMMCDNASNNASMVQ